MEDRCGGGLQIGGELKMRSWAAVLGLVNDKSVSRSAEIVNFSGLPTFGLGSYKTMLDGGGGRQAHPA